MFYIIWSTDVTGSVDPVQIQSVRFNVHYLKILLTREGNQDDILKNKNKGNWKSGKDCDRTHARKLSNSIWVSVKDDRIKWRLIWPQPSSKRNNQREQTQSRGTGVYILHDGTAAGIPGNTGSNRAVWERHLQWKESENMTPAAGWTRAWCVLVYLVSKIFVSRRNANTESLYV